MLINIRLRLALASTLAFFLFNLSRSAFAAERGDSPIRLNIAAVAHATQLISSGRVVSDLRSEWHQHRPTASEENAFIRARGFQEYAKWYLGIDERRGERTKARYKFPFGDFTDIHRCGLLAAKTRASQWDYHDIRNAAEELAKKISKPR